jgi:hypothetical protein
VFCCVAEIIIETVLYIDCWTDFSAIYLTLWRLDGVNWHFVSGFMVWNVDVRVQYRLVCCMLCCVEIELY